jgi:hypothetical protein
MWTLFNQAIESLQPVIIDLGSPPTPVSENQEKTQHSSLYSYN